MQFQEDKWEPLYTLAKTLVDKNIQFNEIEKELSKKTDDVTLIAEIISQLKKVHYAIKRKHGLIKIGFGALFLFFGFLITCINFHSNQSFTLVMYSTTSVGLALVFWGLYEVIG